jgi:RsiW-degrading membrane proteinase PrsW (M82 family)
MRQRTPGNPGHNLRHSEVFPILSNPAQLWSKGYLIPGLITVVATVVLLVAVNGPDFFFFVNVVAYYVTFIQCLVVYLLCGRRQLWLPMIVIFAVTYGLFYSPLFFAIAPLFKVSWATNLEHSPDFILSFIGNFFTTGLLEEMYKALPLLALAAFAVCWSRSPAALPGSIGINEPLDGIALGVAAGAAFALLETIQQYVPINAMHLDEVIEISKTKPEEAKALFEMMKGPGLELLIARLGSQIAGHLAFSGYFGYFIGLAVLRRKSAGLLLLIGIASAAALHAAWDATHAPFLHIAIGALSYACLVGAILKARRISPTRVENFATVALPLPGPHPHDIQRTPYSGPLRDIPNSPHSGPLYVYHTAPGLDHQSPAASNRALILNIADVRRPLVAGLQIEPQALGSAGAGRGRGPVAEVESPAADGDAVLRNTGARSWQVKLPTGQVRQVDAGKAVRLEAGVVIDFGGIKGMVENG